MDPIFANGKESRAMKRWVRVATMGSVVALLILLGVMMTPLGIRAQDADWVWANYTYDKKVWALAPGGQVLWAGTWGGLLRWDLVDHSYTKFTPADGFTGTFVEDIAVDGQGRAWVGHDRGLSVCDGTGCTSYDPENSDMPAEWVKEVVAASDGRIWLHSRSVNGSLGEGVTVFNGATWTNYDTLNSGLLDDDVRSMAADLNGHLWFGHWDGDVSEFDGVGTWTPHYDIDFNHRTVHGIAVDNLNRKWFITGLPTLIVLDGTSWTRYYPTFLPQDIAMDGEARPWMASLVGLWTFDGTNWTRYHTGNSGLLDDSMRAVAAQGQKVWVGYADSPNAVGLTQFDGASWSHYETVDGFPANTGYFGAAADPEGRVWFGASEGAASFHDVTWTKYESGNSGLSDLPYSMIKEDRGGHLWFAGKSGGGLVEFDGDDTWTQHCGTSPKPGCYVEAVAVDEVNTIWVGSKDSGPWRGLSMFNGSSWTTFTSSSCLDSDVVGALTIDGAGNKWVGCTTRFGSSTDCTAYGSKELAIEAHYMDILGTVAEDPRCWVADPDRGLVWTDNATTHGVSAWNGSSWTDYSRPTMGFPSAPFSWYAHLAGLDAAGNLWARLLGGDLSDGGVTSFDGTDWTPYRRWEGVLEVPYDMVVDGYGRVWFTSQLGINMFYDPGQSTQATVTVDPASDGKLTSIDGSTRVIVPAASVSQDTIVTYTPMTSSATDPLADIGHFFELSAVISGTTTPVTSFSPGYTITVNYAGENTELAFNDTLGLYWWDGGQWNLEPTSVVDTTNLRVGASPSHMTLFAVLGEGWKLTYVPLVLKGY
jgi:ligand-binding sensor domain-containing protein